MEKEDFNLDQVMQESKERTEDLATKDELHQEDFSSDVKVCGCAVNTTSMINNNDSRLTRPRSNPIVFLEDQTQHREVAILETINQAHKKYIKAKYELYRVRSEFYTDKANWDNCKAESGKATDSVFREYARKNLADLMEAREIAEFEYEQAKRVFESL